MLYEKIDKKEWIINATNFEKIIIHTTPAIIILYACLQLWFDFFYGNLTTTNDFAYSIFLFIFLMLCAFLLMKNESVFYVVLCAFCLNVTAFVFQNILIFAIFLLSILSLTSDYNYLKRVVAGMKELEREHLKKEIKEELLKELSTMKEVSNE